MTQQSKPLFFQVHEAKKPTVFLTGGSNLGKSTLANNLVREFAMRRYGEYNVELPCETGSRSGPEETTVVESEDIQIYDSVGLFDHLEVRNPKVTLDLSLSFHNAKMMTEIMTKGDGLNSIIHVVPGYEDRSASLAEARYCAELINQLTLDSQSQQGEHPAYILVFKRPKKGKLRSKFVLCLLYLFRPE